MWCTLHSVLSIRTVHRIATNMFSFGVFGLLGSVLRFVRSVRSVAPCVRFVRSMPSVEGERGSELEKWGGEMRGEGAAQAPS